MSSSATTKRPATVTGASGSGPKRAKGGDKPLWALRVRNRICSNCRQDKAKHVEMGCDMGSECSAPFVPPTAEERQALAGLVDKGKGKA